MCAYYSPDMCLCRYPACPLPMCGHSVYTASYPPWDATCCRRPLLRARDNLVVPGGRMECATVHQLSYPPWQCLPPQRCAARSDCGVLSAAAAPPSEFVSTYKASYLPYAWPRRPRPLCPPPPRIEEQGIPFPA